MLIKAIIFLNLIDLLLCQIITDLTVLEGSNGTDVVLATISRIQNSSVFSDDNGFLRRVAFVESRDGTDPDTFREGYNGGIWQVDEIILRQTQNVTLHPILSSPGGIFERLLEELYVDWSAIVWRDLRIPLFSGLAARIFFELADSDIPAITDLPGQGTFWKSSGFNTDELDTAPSFVESIAVLESIDITRISEYSLYVYMSSYLYLYSSRHTQHCQKYNDMSTLRFCQI